MNNKQENINPIDPELLKKSNLMMIGIIGYSFLTASLSTIFDSSFLDFLNLISLAVIIGTITTDYKMWKNSGVEMCSRFWGIIYPIYLWKRANILNISKKLFWVWLGTFISYIVIFMSIALWEDNQELIAQSSCEIVNQILEKQASPYNPKYTCKKVSISEKNNNDYKGFATLSSGSAYRKDEVIPISITVVGDEIFVQINP